MIAIPNMDMSETCDMCPIEGCEYINGKFACPLIEISDNAYKAFLIYIKNICNKIEERIGE